MMASGGRWFRHIIRVRYQETDRMGVVYHANYLNWFEIGRTELIRSLGMTYRELEERGLLLPVVDLESHFKLPAKYDDLLAIYTRIEQFTNVRLHFESEVRRLGESGDAALEGTSEAWQNERPGELLVSGKTRHVWLGGDWRPLRIDRAAPDLYELLLKANP